MIKNIYISIALISFSCNKSGKEILMANKSALLQEDIRSISENKLVQLMKEIQEFALKSLKQRGNKFCRT
jgi:hypothetical protein